MLEGRLTPAIAARPPRLLCSFVSELDSIGLMIIFDEYLVLEAKATNKPKKLKKKGDFKILNFYSTDNEALRVDQTPPHQT